MSGMEAILAALRSIGQVVTAPEAVPRIEHIADDSRSVTAGTLFCAVPGTTSDGHAFVPDAVARGAVALVVSRPVSAPVPQIVVRDTRVALGTIAGTWYGNPAADMTVLGVTGTNGKSTTVALVRHLLNADGHAASIGTLGAVDGEGRTVETAGNLTTPGIVGLQAALADLKARGVTRVALEASSHALDQGRLATLVLAGAVYTNLTHEHLDYHPTLEAYRAAKAKLSDLLGHDGVEVVNAEEPAWEALPSRPGIRRVTFGRGTNSTVQAHEIALDGDGARATFVFDGQRQAMELPLLGDFNVANALGASALAWGLGADPEAIAERLASTPQIPGRLERLAAGEFLVLRDYAHTPDALERAIAAVRTFAQARVIVLFGAGGDRDRAKRPLMGRAAAQGADLAIVTSDNPRTEDPDRIIDEIERGMGTTAHVRITDRAEAIHHALAIAKPGDCLLLAGKGHETYQVVGTERRSFDERVIVAAALAQMGGDG
jgi:UDP-N-acetylmuramoyl-L-alanyl-D-glutamate--2,6-diaminopimelate ligase